MIYELFIRIYLVWTHSGSGPNGTISEGTRFDFKIECHGKCSNINITENTHSGDIDLYAAEDKLPTISSIDYSCRPRSSCICQSVASNDKCIRLQSFKTNTLLFTALVVQPHRDLTLTVTGDNIYNVFCAQDGGCDDIKWNNAN